MSESFRILVLPGDGIGPEVMEQAVRVLKQIETYAGVKFELEYALAGGCAIDAHGTPLLDETMERARASHAVLFGSVGGPKWEGLGFDLRPEIAILRLRKELNLFANLRPATLFDPLIEASTLKPEVIGGLDLMIVRECAGGLYFGEPRGIETTASGKRGYNTETYSTEEIERVGRVAFTLARGRRNEVCSVEKANVTESGLVWREVMTALHAREFADVKLRHMYADNCAMQLVRAPKQFDVIVTGNMFGDILSDLASMLTGSLGMLPSATIGATQAERFNPAVYEPIHGSAPDIAGKGLANPMAQILSLGMMLRLSLGMPKEAALVEQACIDALAAGARTPDLGGTLNTTQVGDAVIAHLERITAVPA
ncbi:MAG: 3-isopropylmalate dehydrogenase [Edaphobacter sp.]|uniref:3-isopropylmalate dehydrogenase n=1 Tax=Edaphobacter sp. TaxID=1934404 RepID=UPI00239B12BB|nr:3-isopropylmalate dehydrogenase [Edaphobacter sp.]MDE1177963.1 3-isopropylmalate dehydrogenase [Edaphobacter sp.]